MKPISLASALSALLALAAALPAPAGELLRKETAVPAAPPLQPALPPGPAPQEPSRLYVLRPNDIILIKVYQEEDLATQARIARDGSITMPLLGTVNLRSNTVEQAVSLIREQLAKDYLVNPQVSLSIVEYGKRRFTVLGQVNRPGTYEMTSDEPVNLLEAIASAGGYTRIGNSRKVIVQRMVGDRKEIFKLDAASMAQDKNSKPFMIQPEDTITVGEKWI
jgi:polysaccharide export outer membrane protein